MARKTIAVDEALHAAWSAAAEAKGESLVAYVTAAVESVRTGQVARLVQSVPQRPFIDPRNCTNRLRPGGYCRICGAIHK